MEALAAQNLERLRSNPYPGRGIIIGRSEAGSLIQVYWVMGRSPLSRNRILEDGGGGRIFTGLATPVAEGTDVSLLIYDAMLEADDDYVVSNGSQTEQILNDLSAGFARTLEGHAFEPDAPNFTPRISGWVNRCGTGALGVVSRSLMDDTCERRTYYYAGFVAGCGRCIHTYDGDGKPLPSFTGSPYLVPLLGTCEEIANQIWETLNLDNRVALVAKEITDVGSEVLIINKHDQ